MKTRGGYNIKLVTFIFDWYTFHYENNYCFYLYYQLISLAHAICIQSTVVRHYCLFNNTKYNITYPCMRILLIKYLTRAFDNVVFTIHSINVNNIGNN